MKSPPPLGRALAWAICALLVAVQTPAQPNSPEETVIDGTFQEAEGFGERVLDPRVAGVDPGANAGTPPPAASPAAATPFVTNAVYRLVVNGIPVIRVDASVETPNLVSGHPSNRVAAATMGAVIGGGGRMGNPNAVAGNFGAIGGGMGNAVHGPYSSIGGGFGNAVHNSGSTIGGGIGNTATNWNATVAGGRDNLVAGLGAAIGGGRGNVASNRYATIPGGYFNVASGAGATIGGGFANAATGFIASIPGGSQNEAAGEYSLAAGRRARAHHDGTLVWADSTDADFVSTQPDQVLFRARGGVGIDTASTPEKLTVAGNVAPSAGDLYDLGTVELPWRALHVQEEIRYPDRLLFSRGGAPMLELTPDGEIIVHGVLRAAAIDAPGHAPPRAGDAAQPRSIDSQAIQDGSIQLRDLDLTALGGLIGTTVHALTSPLFRAVETDLQAMRATSLDRQTRFGGAVTGTVEALRLQSGAVGSEQIADGGIQLADLDLEALATAFVQRDGGRLTGALQLPADGLSVGDGQFVVRDGAVGVGTSSPRATLDVEGRIRIAGGEPAEGRVLVAGADGLARWADPAELTTVPGLRDDAPHYHEGSLFGPRVEQPLVLQVAGRRAFRIEPERAAPNLIGGSEGNTAQRKTSGVTISGGGTTEQPQRVDADFGSIGGGAGNLVEGSYGTVGGGWMNTARGIRSTVGGGRMNEAVDVASVVAGGYSNRAAGGYAFVGGGYANEAGGYVTTVGGGWSNAATGAVSTVAGGQGNRATGPGSTVAGGWDNRAEGKGAMVLGGNGNSADGDFSAAGGFRSIAAHPGAFVWSDSEALEFVSTAADQFLIKARGNVGIDTSTPGEKLSVSGNVAPADTRRHHLGSPALRWESVFVGSTIDAQDALTMSIDGRSGLSLNAEGDVDVSGTLRAARFVGDGAQLTDLPPTPPAEDSILNEHIRSNADIDPGKIRGGALTAITAEALYHAFGLEGAPDHVLDGGADALATAAIEALHHRLKARDKRIQELEDENRALAQRVSVIERLLATDR